jgi:YegS/Rv2252/BmrU family lipid kinase
MTRAVLVYNPTAGRSPSQAEIQKTLAGLRSIGWWLEYFESDSAVHTTQLARQAAESGSDVLIIAGGDGSIERAVAGLIGSDTALGVLPMGTANVFAQELGLKTPSIARRSSYEDNVAFLKSAVIHPVDVGTCNGTPFLLWAGVGLDGYIVHKLEPRQRWSKKLGVSYYAARAASQASSWKGQTLHIKTGDSEIEGHYILAVMSNIRLYAGGITTLSPHARMDDGQMELWLFSGESMYDVLRHATNLLTGRHVNSDQVQLVPVKQLVLESQEPLFIQLDGDPYQESKRVELNVLHHGLNILVPPDKPSWLAST